MKIVTSIFLTAAFLTLAACSPKQATTTNDTKLTTTTATTSATTNDTEPTTTATTSATTIGTEPTTTTATTSATTIGTEPTTTTATISATTIGTEPTTTATTSATPVTPVDQKQEDTFTPIKKGGTVTIQDFADIVVTGHKISKKIESSNAAVSYESKKDSTLLALIIEAKNLSAEWMEADKFAKVSLKYDNKYHYDTFSAIELLRGETFANTNSTLVEPLDTGTLYYLAEIPNEVAKSDKPLKAEIKVKDKIYEYSIR